MKKQVFFWGVLVVFFLSNSVVFGQNAKPKLYILYNSCSKISHHVTQDSTIVMEFFDLNWSNGPTKKKLQIKKQDNGTWKQNIQLEGTSNFNRVSLLHTKSPKEQDKTIPKKELYTPTNLLLHFDDFCYFDESLLQTITSFTTMYILNLDAVVDDAYVVKEVERL